MRSHGGAKSGRRWLQFSLRGLLVLTVLVALGLGWIASERRKVWLEARAVAEIARLGGVALRADEVAVDISALLAILETASWKTTLFGEEYSRPVMSVEFEPDVGPEAVALLAPLRELTSLKLVGARIGDEEMPAILEHSGLKELDLSATDITDVGGMRLAELPSLMFLRLDHTTITERTLDALSGKDLRRVSIQDVDVRLEAAERFEASLPAVLPFQYAPMPSQEHRLAAQRLVRLGVDVSTWQRAPGKGRGGSQADESPVTDVVFARLGDWKIGPNDLEPLGELENVRMIYLSEPVCGREYLERLVELNVARKIQAYAVQLPESDSAFTPRTLRLLPRMTRLESLQLSFDQIRGDVLGCLPHVTRLRSFDLQLNFEGDVTEDGLRPLGECRVLEELTLRNMVFSAGALDVLAECPGLRRLALIDVDPAKCGGAGGREMKLLRSLTIRTSVRRAVDPLEIVPAANLEELVLHGVDLREEAIEGLERCTTLRHLVIGGTVLEKEQVERLEALVGLDEFVYSLERPVPAGSIGFF